jgi:hypothetical protein
MHLAELEGKCFWGKIPIDLLGSSLENCVTLNLGHTVELASAVSMSPSFLEVCQLNFSIVYVLMFLIMCYNFSILFNHSIDEAQPFAAPEACFCLNKLP